MRCFNGSKDRRIPMFDLIDQMVKAANRYTFWTTFLKVRSSFWHIDRAISTTFHRTHASCGLLFCRICLHHVQDFIIHMGNLALTHCNDNYPVRGPLLSFFMPATLPFQRLEYLLLILGRDIKTFSFPCKDLCLIHRPEGPPPPLPLDLFPFFKFRIQALITS